MKICPKFALVAAEGGVGRSRVSLRDIAEDSDPSAESLLTSRSRRAAPIAGN
jgi:hypothetical protein